MQFTTKGHRGGKGGVDKLAKDSLTVPVRSDPTRLSTGFLKPEPSGTR